MLDIIMTLAEAFRAQHKQLYMVGGTVRDVLLHREQSNDADLATDAQPDEIKRLVAPTRPSAIVLVGERFGTVRLHYGSDIIEITTFRTERYNPESRKPEVCFGTRLEDDLLRRDFTINALARDPLNGHIIDLFGGRQDLETHILRAVGNEPDKRFDEDPLRLLRAVRFAAQLDFTIEPQTRRSILRQAPKLQKISRERIRDEMNKLCTRAARGGTILSAINDAVERTAARYRQAAHEEYRRQQNTFFWARGCGGLHGEGHSQAPAF